MNRKDQVETAIGGRNADDSPRRQRVPAAADQGVAADSVGFTGATRRPTATTIRDSSLAVMPGPAHAPAADGKNYQGQPAGQGPEAAFEARWPRALLDRRAPSPGQIRAAYAQHPALKVLADQTARVASLGTSETQLMAQTEHALDGDVGLLRAAVKRTGINPDQFLRKVAAIEGVGGPEIPLDQVHVEGIADPKFEPGLSARRRGDGRT